MARLISYPTISTLALGDLFPVTDVSGVGKPLKNVTATGLLGFIETNAGLWKKTTGGINYSEGNVGIGTETPTEKLQITGNVSASGNITGNNGFFTTSITTPEISGNTEITGDLQVTNIAADGSISAAGTITAPAVNATLLQGELEGTISSATTGTTQANTTDNTTVATTAFVQNLIGTIPTGLVFQGTWNAATNTPTLASGTGTTGHFYIVSVDGTTNLDGITDWKVGDWAVFVEQGATDAWEKVDNSSVLDGAGTGNQISKWTGSGTSNTLTNSIITDNGTNVGIGTASPTAKLHVSGGDIKGDGLIKVENSSDNNIIGKLIINYGSGNNPRLNSVGGTEIDFQTDLVIRSNKGLYSDTSSSTGLIIGSQRANTPIKFLTSPATNSTYSEAMRIAGDGNVGIGTTSPSEKLDVAGNIRLSDESELYIKGSTNSRKIVRLDNTSDKGLITLNRTDLVKVVISSDFSHGGHTYFNGLNTNVGIGTTSPSYKLDVTGTGRFTSTLTCQSLVQTSQRDQKKDISDITKTKSIAIPFKEYKYKSESGDRKRYGVVVEDIEAHYPELVHIDADGIKGVNYIDLLVKRVAELEKELLDISLTQGPKGDTGVAGINGNSHLDNVKSIKYNTKTRKLEISIEGLKSPLLFTPAL